MKAENKTFLMAGIVYALYELTEEEVAIIEKASK